jgi:hypothetical protein
VDTRERERERRKRSVEALSETIPKLIAVSIYTGANKALEIPKEINHTRYCWLETLIHVK